MTASERRIDAWIEEFEDFRESLHYEDKERFDRLLSRARMHDVATSGGVREDLDAVMLLGVALAQQRELDVLRNEELVLLEKRVRLLETRIWDESNDTSAGFGETG